MRFNKFGGAAIRLEACGRGTSRAAAASRPWPTCALKVPISGKPEIGCLRDDRTQVRAVSSGRGGQATDYVSVKLNSPSFSIEVTTLSPGLSHACLSLG